MLGSYKLIEHLLIPMRVCNIPEVRELETSLYPLFKEVKKDTIVALSRESANEVFSGNPWFH